MTRVRFVVLFVCAAVAASPASAAPSAAREDAKARLRAATRGAVRFSDHAATGAARFVSLERGARARLGRGPAQSAQEKAAASAAFFREYGAAIGVDDPTALRLESSRTDRLGETHLTFKQFHGDVPVFAGVVKTHFDAAHQLKAVTGTAVPDIAVNESPVWSAEDASAVALDAIVRDRGASATLGIGATKLWVFREGLVKGVRGESRLAWEVEVTDGAGVRERVFVDAHTGKEVDRISAVHDDLFRRAYDGREAPDVPSNYPSGAYWLEGQKYPTASQEANNMLDASIETYAFFSETFGRDSFDDAGTKMDAIFDRGYSCPNASWNGTFISFCPGITTDDVTAHEWGHAYTQYTHGLIYQWQSGALNESYSDIWGETVDRINGRDSKNQPFAARTDPNACSSFSPPRGQLHVDAPAGIAGDYFAQSALFGPQLTATGTPGDVVAALDPADAAGPTTLDGCSPFTNAAAVSGKIALVNRGSCNFTVKVANAQAANAIGVIIANNSPTGLPGMGGADATITIPSLGVQQSTGTIIRDALAAGSTVNVTLRAQPGGDVSARWLMGEDTVPPSGDGALRDMWNPTCYSNPGKVSDTAYYECSTADNGGVHINSGIPNHAFALLVDGGSYNGQTVAAIGLTKASHIYFRAADVYQVHDSDFVDHANALEQSCADLTGGDVETGVGAEPDQQIGTTDCAEVTKAIAAVELRTRPAFCNFPPLLNPGLPALCAATTTSGVAETIKMVDFETEPAGWTVGRLATAPTFVSRDWARQAAAPGRTGTAFFGPDPNIGHCTVADDQRGVLTLTSEPFSIPNDGTKFARATFFHWFALEPGWDGGNLAISVNNGPFTLVPPAAFTFNNYNFLLFSAADGNTNPLAGQPSWTSNRNGDVGEGTWGRTHVNLGTFAPPGSSVRLQWRLGTDSCGGRTGWYVDDVHVFTCTPNVPAISIAATTTFVEGDGGFAEKFVTVTSSGPTIVPVSASYRIVSGTAVAGNDFAKEGLTGTVTIPAGATSAQIRVLVKGDDEAEADETFSIILSNPSKATIANGTGQVTIDDDDAVTTAGL